jgi:hypothetical protein
VEAFSSQGARGSLRQENCMFQVSMGYIRRPHLKKQTKKTYN